MKHVLASILLLSALGFVHSRSRPPREAIRAWHLKTEQEPLRRIETSPVPGRPDLVVAICDYQELMWGFCGVYCIRGGRVRWAVHSGIDEQSIHRARALRLTGFTNPVVEVFGISHRGDGNLYLYELRENGLVPLLETRAVDFHQDQFTFQDGCLTPDYRDLNGDGYDDLTLEGVVEEWDEKEDKIIHREPIRQVFIWNAQLQRFEEDVSSRVGVAEYYD